ncbi:MAG: CDP-alcohol phosphatidyltransferase family protein [Magnetospirillum sp. WYHS-4]
MIQAVPNLITLGRLIAVPILVWLILDGRLDVAFWVFVGAGVSDAVDGFIAKRFHAETVIGGFLDPLADKALLVCAYLTLGYTGHLPIWLVILVVFRDVLIVGGAILYQTLTNDLKAEPLKVSKVNTFAQIVLAGWVLGAVGLGFEVTAVSRILVLAVAATTAVSGAAYVWTWGCRAMMMEDPP